MGYKRKKTEGPAAAEANDPKPKVVEEEEEPLEEEDPLPESEAGDCAAAWVGGLFVWGWMLAFEEVS